jgi:hypothetical protein
MIFLIKSTPTLGQILVQTPVEPLCPWASSGTFAAFSKFHLNTPKSPNIKVFQFFEGHNFAFGWHCKFGVENGEKLGQLQFLLFIGARKNQNLAWRSFSNHWEKHRMAFVKVVEGHLIYNFAIYPTMHFYSNFWRTGQSNRVSRNNQG